MLYQQTRRRLLAEALCSLGSFSDDDLDNACLREAQDHHQIWTEEHRTLTAAERVGGILSHLRVCLPDDVVARLARAYEEGILERPPVLIEGAREAIEQLARHYRLGIISDVGFSPGRVLKVLLEREGLLDLFDSLVFSDEAGRSKPHWEVFERTAQLLRAHPAEIVHVGDLEHTDIIGAKRAGFRAIRFSGVTPMEQGERTIADRIASDFSELPRLIESLDLEP